MDSTRLRASPLGDEPGERRRLRSRLLRLFPRAGWPGYIATALLGVLLATSLGLLAPLVGWDAGTNIPGRPAYLIVSIFIAPALETAIFLSLPAFLAGLITRDTRIRYACLYLLVPVFALSHLKTSATLALTALFLGAAFAAVYVRADRLRGRSRRGHTPFLAASATHGLYNLFTALLYFMLPPAV